MSTSLMRMIKVDVPKVCGYFCPLAFDFYNNGSWKCPYRKHLTFDTGQRPVKACRDAEIGKG